MLNYSIFTFFLFCLGLFGIIFNRESLITVLMSIELILLSIILNFIFFSITIDDILGEIFALLILTVAAAESAIGLAIIIVYFRVNKDISIMKINKLSL